MNSQLVPSRAIYQLGDDNALLFPGRRLRPARSFFPFLLSRAGGGGREMTTQDGEDIVQRGKPISSKTYIVGFGGGRRGKGGDPKKYRRPAQSIPFPLLKKVPSSAHCCCSLGGGMMSASRRANGQTTKFLFFSRFHLLGSFIINQKSVWVRRRGIMGRRAFRACGRTYPKLRTNRSTCDRNV